MNPAALAAQLAKAASGGDVAAAPAALAGLAALAEQRPLDAALLAALDAASMQLSRRLGVASAAAAECRGVAPPKAFLLGQAARCVTLTEFEALGLFLNALLASPASAGANAAVDALADVLGDAAGGTRGAVERHLRVGALCAVGRVGRLAPDVLVESAAARLRDADAAVCAAAAAALACVGGPRAREAAVDGLLALLSHAEPQPRVAAARALGALALDDADIAKVVSLALAGDGARPPRSPGTKSPGARSPGRRPSDPGQRAAAAAARALRHIRDDMRRTDPARCDAWLASLASDADPASARLAVAELDAPRSGDTPPRRMSRAAAAAEPPPPPRSAEVVLAELAAQLAAVE